MLALDIQPLQRRSLGTANRIPGYAFSYGGEPDIPMGMTLAEYRGSRRRRRPGGAADDLGMHLIRAGFSSA